MAVSIVSVNRRERACHQATEIGDGARVVVDRKGGLGRTGTVACLLLLDSWAVSNASDAMRKVRSVRRGAIEASAQEAFLQP